MENSGAYYKKQVFHLTIWYLVALFAVGFVVIVNYIFFQYELRKSLGDIHIDSLQQMTFYLFTVVMAVLLIAAALVFRLVVRKINDIFGKLADEVAERQKIEKKLRAVLEELSEAKKRDEKLIVREQKLLQSKSEFISIASHQLRTPITAIQWSLEHFLRTKKINKEHRSFLVNIYILTRRLAELVGVLLDISKIEEGKINFIPQPIELVNFIKKHLSEYETLFEEKKIKVIFKNHPPEIKITTDRSLLFGIMQALIANAIDYTPKNGKIEISLKTLESSYILSIKDTGIGIPKQEQDNIFKKFARGSNAKLVKVNGSGLGLYVVKKIVELLEGKIWFESPATGGEMLEFPGTEFFVELPLKARNSNLH